MRDHQLSAEQINTIALAIVANKASVGLADMPDGRVMEQAASIYDALLVVCAGIEAALKAGDPTAPAKREALQWFVTACLDKPKAATVN